jgi:peptidoglycan/LPS O-acetylase OafA/YrhL
MAEPQKDLPPLVYNVLRVWFKTGWAGVSLFFVLSGFLVSSLMFNEFVNTGDIRFGRFYIRRGLKIYPAFYCMLAASVILGYLGTHYFQRDLVPPGKMRMSIILSEVFFLQNYLGYIWVHVWSLAVEEHFYISLGIIVFLIMKFYPSVRPGLSAQDRFKPIPWLCGIVFVTVIALRYIYLYGTTRTMDERFAGTCFTHLRIDSLFFGVFIAYWVKFRATPFLTWVKGHTIWLLIAGLFLISPSLKYEETDDFMFVPGFTLMYMGFGCLLLFTLYHPWKSNDRLLGRFFDLLAYIGQNSYSVYLWHFPVMYLVGLFLPATGKNYYLLIAVQNIAGLSVGLVMAKLIEMPVLKLRDNMFASTRSLNAGV